MGSTTFGRLYMPKITAWLEWIIDIVLGPFSYFPDWIEKSQPTQIVLFVIVAMALYQLIKSVMIANPSLGIIIAWLVTIYLVILIPILVMMMWSQSTFGCAYPWKRPTQTRGCISIFK